MRTDGAAEEEMPTQSRKLILRLRRFKPTDLRHAFRPLVPSFGWCVKQRDNHFKAASTHMCHAFSFDGSNLHVHFASSTSYLNSILTVAK